MYKSKPAGDNNFLLIQRDPERMFKLCISSKLVKNLQK